MILPKMIELDKRAIGIMAEKNGFTGLISFFLGKDLLFNRAFGYRDRPNKILSNTETRFGIASGTKLFTALGILTLIEKGKLVLSSRVSDIFNEELTFISPAATIEDILTHSSGIYDYYDEEFIEDFDNFCVDIPWSELTTASDYLPLFQNHLPKFTPGKRFSYSNGGYVFLAVIIEKLSGRLYRDYLSDYVLKPAGMKHSGFFAFNELPANTANGFIEEDTAKTNIYQLPIRGGGDGGMYTNNNDLCDLWHCLFEDRLLHKTLVKELCNKKQKVQAGIDYGLGLYITKVNDADCFFITGCDAGVGFHSYFFPEYSLLLNLFSNVTDGTDKMNKHIFHHELPDLL